MIKMVTGVPGAGKTYFAVKHLLENYYTDNNDGTFKIKADVTVISNIDGLLLDHLSLDEELETFIDVMCQDACHLESICDEKMIDEKRWLLRNDKMKFFEKEFQENYSARHGKIVYVIDECQDYFSTKMHKFKYSRNVFLWFETHRHMGQDIILITQSKMKIARDIRDLVEFEIRAVPKSLSIFGEMKYNEYVNGMKSNALPKSTRPNKKIFAIYKSMSMKGSEKHGTALKSIAVLMLIGLIAGGSFLYFGIFKKYGDPGKVQEKIKAVELGAARSPGRVDAGAIEVERIWFPVSWGALNGSLKNLQIYDEINNLLLPLSMWQRETKLVERTLYAKFLPDEIELIMAIRAAGEESPRDESEDENQAVTSHPAADEIEI